MTTFVRIDCNLGTIAYFALQKLIDDGVCTSTTGFVGQNPGKNWVPPSTGYYVVTAERQALLSPETNTWNGELTVTAHTASLLDIAMRDPINIVKTLGNGIGARLNLVSQSLNLYDMTNGSFYFLAQPLRMTQQGDIERYVEENSPSPSWTKCGVSFAFVYGEDPTYFNPEANGVGEFSDGFDGGFS